jgi:hypothetical protein
MRHFLLFLLIFILLSSTCLTTDGTSSDRIKVTCGESVFACRSFRRYGRLGHYTCWKGDASYIDLPLSVGDSCKVGEI